MEPSRDTAGRRRRARLALARQFDTEAGFADLSPVVYRFADGWTVRRLPYLFGQHREGLLMRSCLAGAEARDRNCWSLRDPDNLPHATFTLWRRVDDSPVDDAVRIARPLPLIVSAGMLLLADPPFRQPLKPEYAARLLEFAERATLPADACCLPADSEARRVAILDAVAPVRQHAVSRRLATTHG